MRTLLTLVAVPLVMSCGSQVPPSGDVVAASLDQPYYGEASDAAKAAGVNYRALMQRAVRKDPVALRRLVRLCSDPHFDGAAAEVHAQYLRDLLRLWGDVPFAAVLRDLSVRERRSLRWAFSAAWYRDFSRSYPTISRVVYALRQI